MARKTGKTSTEKSAPAILSGEDAIGAFLLELHEARQYRYDLENANHGDLPTQIVARSKSLAVARTKESELEQRYSELRGDFLVETEQSDALPIIGMPRPDWRMRIQAEAYEYWLRLRASGCSPSVHSICDPMAKWCIDNDVRGSLGQHPRSGTIRNTVLGAKHWNPPTHSVEQAQKHIAQVAQPSKPPAS